MYQMILSNISQHIQKGQHLETAIDSGSPPSNSNEAKFCAPVSMISLILCIKVLDIKEASELQNYIHLVT